MHEFGQENQSERQYEKMVTPTTWPVRVVDLERWTRALKFKNIARNDCKRDIAYCCKRPKMAIREGEQHGGGGRPAEMPKRIFPSTSEVIGFTHFPLSINSCLSRPESRGNVVLGKQNSKQQEDPPSSPSPSSVCAEGL